MIEREHGVFEVTCDSCPEGHDSFDVDDGWDSMITELKGKIVRHEGEYDPVERALGR